MTSQIGPIQDKIISYEERINEIQKLIMNKLREKITLLNNRDKLKKELYKEQERTWGFDYDGNFVFNDEDSWIDIYYQLFFTIENINFTQITITHLIIKKLKLEDKKKELKKIVKEVKEEQEKRNKIIEDQKDPNGLWNRDPTEEELEEHLQKQREEYEEKQSEEHERKKWEEYNKQRRSWYYFTGC
jgi:hypothetical protein